VANTQQIQPIGKTAKLIVEDNVLALFSDEGLMTLSSAIFNGGFKKVKAVLNVGVPEGYNDRFLHLDPLTLIRSSAAKLGLKNGYLAMVTAANIKNYSLATKKTEDFSVSVAATAGCSHGESSGEHMNVEEAPGTINILVLVDGKPTKSCMVASMITATEAKSAALRDFDVRSLYTGDSATGSITDSMAISSTSQGKQIAYGGPASKLGELVGFCTRTAVTQALLKQEPIWCHRTVLDRLKERQLTLNKLAAEISKIEGLAVDEKALSRIVNDNPIANAYLLAAARLDDDYKKNLLPTELGNTDQLSERFGCLFHSEVDYPKISGHDLVDLPPFLKYSLISIIREALYRK